MRYPTPTERAEEKDALAKAEAQRADIAIAEKAAIEQKNNALRRRLSELGIDPDSIASLAP